MHSFQSSVAKIRTAGSAVGIVGALIMLTGIALAWPQPSAIVPVAALDFVALTLVAFRYDIPAAHVLALPCLWLASLVTFHAMTRHVTWNAGADATTEALLQPTGGAALAGLSILTALGTWSLSRLKLIAHATIYAVLTTLCAVLVLALLNARGFGAPGDPALATWIYMLYALTALAIAWKSQRGIIGTIGWFLLGAAFAQFFVSHAIGRDPWSTAILTWASVMAGACVAARKLAKEAQPTFDAIPQWLALLASAAGVSIALANSSAPLLDVAPMPLFWMTAVWLVIAMAGAHPLIGSAAFCCAATATYFVLIHRFRANLIPSDVRRLLDVNATVLAVFAATAAAAWRIKARRLEALQPNGEIALPRFIRMQFVVAVVLAGLVLIPATALVIAQPWSVFPSRRDPLNDVYQWIAVAAVGLALAERKWAQRARWSIRALALGALTVVAMIACTLGDLSRWPWIDFHLLIVGVAATGWLVLGYGASIAAKISGVSVPDADAHSPNGLTLQYHRPAQTIARIAAGRQSLIFEGRRLLPSVITWVIVTCITAVLLALRAMAGDPDAPWFCVGATVACASLLAMLACWSFHVSLLYSASILFNIAACMWFFDRSYIAGALLANFACVNAIALALPGVAWLVLELNLFRPASPQARAAAPTRAISILSLLIIAGLVAMRGVERFGHVGEAAPHPLLLYGALLAVTANWLSRLWDPRSRAALAGLYVLGLSTIVLQFCELDWETAEWAASVMLGGFGLLVSVLWSIRDVLRPIAARLRMPERLSEHGFLSAFNTSIAVIVLLIGLGGDFYFPGSGTRFIDAAAALSQAVALSLLSRGIVKNHLRESALGIGAFACLAMAWAAMPPLSATALDRSAVAFITLAAVAAMYLLAWAKLLPREHSWSVAARRQGMQVGLVSGLALAVTLGTEVYWFMERGNVAAGPAVIASVLIALLGGCAGLLLIATRGEDLSDGSRAAGVYAAEVALGLAFVHARLTMPFLFHGFFHAYWPLVVMTIAFLGVGISAGLERRAKSVLAGPLRNTGALLPLLPVIAFWVAPPEHVDFGLLLITVALLYSLLSALRRSFGFAILAILAANGALWHVLANAPGWSFFQHPQVWLIPISLAVLVAAQLNRDRLSFDQLRLIRYASLLVIYASSTADVFLNGVANAPWLPLVLAAFSVVGVFIGILFRIRSFLYLGTTFLLLAIITMIYYASSELHWTWIWYVAGIALGAGIIVLFALFEKKRSQMVAMVEGLKTWQ